MRRQTLSFDGAKVVHFLILAKNKSGQFIFNNSLLFSTLYVLNKDNLTKEIARFISNGYFQQLFPHILTTC